MLYSDNNFKKQTHKKIRLCICTEMSDTDNRKRQQTFSKMAAEPPSLVIRLNTFDINILNINSANSRLSISSSTWTTSSKYVKKTAKLAQRLTVGAAILNYSFTNRWHLQAKLLFIQRVPSPSKLVNKLHPQQCVCFVIKPAQIAIKGTVHQKNQKTNFSFYLSRFSYSLLCVVELLEISAAEMFDTLLSIM